MSVLTERGREEKGREEERKGGSSLTLGKERKVGAYVALFAR